MVKPLSSGTALPTICLSSKVFDLNFYLLKIDTKYLIWTLIWYKIGGRFDLSFDFLKQKLEFQGCKNTSFIFYRKDVCELPFNLQIVKWNKLDLFWTYYDLSFIWIPFLKF